MKDCFGKRMKAYHKCNDCESIESCSFETLVKVLTKKGYEVTTSQYGDLVLVDDDFEEKIIVDDSNLNITTLS